MPSAIHVTPAAPTFRSSTLTTTNDRIVPVRPMTASGGSSWPRTRIRPGLRYGRRTSGSVTRRQMSDRCAIENESIAPKA